MNTTSCFFTADYRDGQVYYAGKKYPAGHFTVQLMNQYYKNDTAARIAVFSGFGFRILGQLRDGFLNVRELHKVGENLHWAVKALPRLTPFDQIDQDVMQAEVSDLFTEESGQEVCEYFRYRGTIANVEEDEVIVGTVDRMINRDYMQHVEKRINRIKELLQFFDRLSDDLYRTHRFLSEFVDRLDEAERLDETHLLPLALEIFGTPEMPFSTQYVSTPKNSRSKGGSITRRLSFDRFASFIVTDFFEGLHYGHYLRQCPICGQYFLMQSARRQIYCSTGYAPEKYRAKRLPCRKYTATARRKERAEWGCTMETDYAYDKLRKIMAIFYDLGGCNNAETISCAATGTGVNHGSLRGFRGLCHNNSVIPGMTEGFSEVPGLHIAAD